jgi:hypothetical protein
MKEMLTQAIRISLSVRFDSFYSCSFVYNQLTHRSPKTQPYTTVT